MSSPLRRISALLVVLLGTVGAPIAIWIFSRVLLPDRIPSPAAIWTALTTPDSGGRLLAAVMLVAAVIAWAVFTVCVLLELTAYVSHRPARRLPGLRVPQTAIAGLISVILVGTLSVAGAGAALGETLPGLPRAAATPATATAIPTPTPRTTAFSPVVTDAPTRPAAAHPVTAPLNNPVWNVRRGDTLWSIAERSMGDTNRWREIVTLNEGRPQPDGRTLRNGDWLETQWQLILPAGATGNTTPEPADPIPAATAITTYEVQPGDTLSGIARYTLHDVTRYPEIAAANNIPDPDVIDIGQKLQIPSADTETTAAGAELTHTDPAPAALGETTIDEIATAPEALPPAEPSDETPAPIASGDTRDSVPDDAEISVPSEAPLPAEDPADEDPAAADPGVAAPTGGNADLPDDETDAGPSAVVIAPPATPPTAPLTSPSPTPNPSSAVNPAEVTDEPASLGRGIETPVGVGLSLALAGAAWMALLAARRRQIRRRPAGQQPVPISPSAAHLARQLKERASSTDVQWMDQALRYAAAASAQRDPNQLPDVTNVWLSSAELQLQLAAPTPAPPPFVAEESSWILPTGALLPDLDWTEPAAPFPALASFGQAEGETLLVDLERVGALSIIGDPTRTQELLNHLAVEFAYNQWCDDLHVTLVGWGADLVALNPDRVRHVAGVAEITAELNARVSETVQLVTVLDTTVLADRVAGAHRDLEDPWTPEVLLTNITDQDSADNLVQALAATAGAGRSAVAVVTRQHTTSTTSIAGGTVATIDTDGTLTIPAVIGDLRVRAAGLNTTAMTQLLEMFTATTQFQHPGPAEEPADWARDMDTAGGLLEPAPAEAATRTDAPPAGDNPVPDTATAAPTSVGGQVVPLRGTAAAAAQTQLDTVLAADPTLDADLDEWHNPVVRRPRISVLGPTPNVNGNGDKPPTRLTRFTEICVYLAVHPNVTADKLTTDLWAEHQQPSGEARRADISRCRTWLGRDETGAKHLPDARNKPYQLTRLMDLELLRRLRKRSKAWLRAGHPTRAAADLTAAMKLVDRTPVLNPEAAASGSGYGWLAAGDPAAITHAALTVIGAGHELVDLALAAGDIDLARETADLMYHVDPQDDVPLCDLIRTAHQAGDRSAARVHARQVLSNNSLEYPEDLPEDIFSIITEVFPEGLQIKAG